MRRAKPSRVFQGVHARLVFPNKEDERAVLDLTRRFSAATRFAYQRLLEGKNREKLKRENGPLCTLFGLNTRYADGAIEKAQAPINSAEELGNNPRKAIFGGRKLFEQLKRKHLSGKALLALKREWKEKRQGLLYSRGDSTKKGNANLRLESENGALWLRINLGNGNHVQALVKTSHPQLNALRERVYASLSYNVTLQLKDGRFYAHFTWSEELPPPVHTKANGVLGIDINADPYHLALAVVSPDGNLTRYLTLSLEEVDRASNKGARELALWEIAHQVVSIAEGCGVAIATERLKYLRKSKRGDGSGRVFRRKQHRFAYQSLLEKIHSLARKRGVEVIEVNPRDTSTIGALKYAPQLHLSKDTAAAFVIGRRALGFEEKLPKGYKVSVSRSQNSVSWTEIYTLQSVSPTPQVSVRSYESASVTATYSGPLPGTLCYDTSCQQAAPGYYTAPAEQVIRTWTNTYTRSCPPGYTGSVTVTEQWRTVKYWTPSAGGLSSRGTLNFTSTTQDEKKSCRPRGGGRPGGGEAWSFPSRGDFNLGLGPPVGPLRFPPRESGRAECRPAPPPRPGPRPRSGRPRRRPSARGGRGGGPASRGPCPRPPP